MKHRAFQIVVVLTLGAIVNVAVAWGCASYLLGVSKEVRRDGVASKIAPTWFLSEDERFGHRSLNLSSLGTQTFVDMFLMTKPIATDDLLSQIPADLRTVPSDCYQQCSFQRDHSGWPMLALVSEIRGTWDAPNAIIRDTVVRTGFEISPFGAKSSGTRNRTLPLRPIWPGFAINTIFYAAMLWVVWFTPRMVRRRIRRTRGRCPACAYPVGSSPVCTECGKMLA